MKLYEFEGLKLFEKETIPTPKRVLIKQFSDLEKVSIKTPYIVKAQVLSGKRGKQGLVKQINEKNKNEIKKLLKKSSQGVLIEELLEPTEQFYLSITYDTSLRSPVLLFSEEGGIEIESVKEVRKFPIDPGKEVSFNLGETELNEVAKKLWNCFQKNDARLAEINPLFKTEKGFIAVDSKVILDEDAFFRHEEFNFEPRDTEGKIPTEAEIAAKEIDRQDHRGSAGSSYMELDGDIAVIAAGGGGSLVNMDALVALGGKPANYTEHSGNPPREKIEKLTKIVLSKKGLNGCWLVGATANFTDMFETLSGFVDGLKAIDPKPTYPIVIRRGGPRWEEAKKMLEEVREKEGFDLHIFGPETPMTATAKIIVDLVNDYKKAKK